MDNKELLQSAKDEAAREWGYELMDDAWGNSHIVKIINRAMEIYGQAQWNAAIDAAAECEALNFADYDKKQAILKLKKP